MFCHGYFVRHRQLWSERIIGTIFWSNLQFSYPTLNALLYILNFIFKVTLMKVAENKRKSCRYNDLDLPKMLLCIAVQETVEAGSKPVIPNPPNYFTGETFGSKCLCCTENNFYVFLVQPIFVVFSLISSYSIFLFSFYL